MIHVIYRINRALSFLLALALCAATALADRREIIFPVEGGIASSQRTDLAFAYDGQIGFAIVYNQSITSAKLFSFSVVETKIISEISLAPDFSLINTSGTFQPILLNVHSNTGLVVVSGKDSSMVQKLMALSADKLGHMRKLWVDSFPACSFPSQDSNLSFNRDGSRIYFIYSTDVEHNALHQEEGARTSAGTEVPSNLMLRWPKSGTRTNPYTSVQAETPSPFRQHLALLRVDDGRIVTTADLSINEPSSILFNEVRNQPIILASGRVFMFSPGSDLLEVEAIIEPPGDEGLIVGQGFSQNGHFLIGYAGFRIGSARKGEDVYVSYDLELRTSSHLSVENDHFPVANGMIFHPATGIMFAPLSLKVRKAPGGVFVFIPTGSRLTDVISLAADGSLARVLQVKIPNRSPRSPVPNRVWAETKSAAISTTGALGFLSSLNGYLFTFDTLTGEIINDELIDPKTIHSIHLLEHLGMLVTSNDTNKLLLVDVSTGPVVKIVEIKNGRTIIRGANFLSGARVEINGVDVDSANRNPDNPGREILIERGKKDFPRGQVFTVVVTNRDGLNSRPFTFTR
jgi:hypothetical protein